MTGYEHEVFILSCLFILIGVTTSCDDIYETCQCGNGENAHEIEIRIKSCKSRHYPFRCRPCKSYTLSALCDNFKNCSRCSERRLMCSECDSHRYGQRCENECKCRNGGLCFGNKGRCNCPPTFTGELCEIKQLKDCGVPPEPFRGSIRYTDTTEGSEVYNNCPDNHVLFGPKVRTCLSNGKWSGNTPRCEYSCVKPVLGPHLKNKEIVKEFDISFLGDMPTIDEIHYECEPGYQLRGHKTLICQSDGKWSSDVPTCVKTCPEISHIPNGRLYGSEFVEDSTLQVICDSDHIPKDGHEFITCLTNGQWDTVPECIFLPRCKHIDIPENGLLRYSGERVDGSTVVVECDKGYISIGKKQRICEKRPDGVYKWSGSKFRCEMVTHKCPEPDRPENGFIDKEDQNDIFYSCNEGYFIEGTDENLCVNGSWLYETPICVKVVTCNQLDEPLGCRICNGFGCSTSKVANCRVPPPENTIIPDDRFMQGSVVEFKYDHRAYNLFGSMKRTCENGIWTGRQPVCEPICGISMEMTPGHDTVQRGQWSWQVRIMWTDNRLVCGGSLIAEDWILTAAHCLEEKTVELPPENVTVLIGQVDSLDDNVIRAKVKRIRRHPSFNNLTYDADIALVQLEKPVIFNKWIHPVCLTKSNIQINRTRINNGDEVFSTKRKITDYKDVEGIVTGWGGSPKHLKMAKVKILHQQECKNFYEMQTLTFTENMLCAEAVGANNSGATSGDSGGSLVVKVGDKWQHYGIVSWGSNDANVNKTYGVYTRVEQFVDWINDIML